jgi:hypothetical protein
MTTYASHYDLRPITGPVLNQGVWGTCAQNDLVSTYHDMAAQLGISLPPLSRMQSYYDTRIAMDTFPADSGTITYVMLEQAKTKGLAYESMWGYTLDGIVSPPPSWIGVFSDDHRITDYRVISPYQSWTTIRDSIKGYLGEGKPVMAGIHLREFLQTQSGPLGSQDSDGKGADLGGHSVEIVGADDSLNGGSYIIKNSWGTSWGDGGYGTIKYTQFDYADNTDLIDLYVISGLNIDNHRYELGWNGLEKEVALGYAGLFGRAADIAGMTYWSNNIPAMLDLPGWADMLLSSTEGVSMYGSMTNTQFVETMYHNLMGRVADAGGLAYWAGLIDNYGVSRGTVYNNLAQTVLIPGGEPEQLLLNKQDFGMYVSVTMQYDGTHNAETAAAMATVTADLDALQIIKIGMPNMLFG